MAKKNRTFSFIVHNCPGHGKIENSEVVKVEFLPAIMTSVLQPIDQGVVKVARKVYRNTILHKILLSYENSKGYKICLAGSCAPFQKRLAASSRSDYRQLLYARLVFTSR